MKKILLTLLAIIAVVIIGLLVTGHGYILTAIARTYLVGNTTANINDYRQFDTRVIESGKAQAWPESPDYPKPISNKLQDHLTKHNAAAFLVIHKGQLISENYFKNYDRDSKTNSFSMAKSILTMMLGKAIEEGYIENLQQPLIEFLPEFKNDPLGQSATIGSLSTMTSGYDWDEHYYSPFSPTVELLYGDDVEDFVLSRSFSSEPEQTFYYSSASTQLLAIVLDRALKAKNPDWTLTDYLSQKLWQPLGMNDAALWHLDDEGMELAYCCISSNARNFGKFGQLMLQGGFWNNQQLLDPYFIQLMSEPFKVPNYGYSTWINQDNEAPYYALRGHLGQRVIIVPEYQLVVVRLGETDGNGIVASEQFYIKEALKMIETTN
ncbi:serine hydrolase [Kangiella sp. HZ709]|uniref:serine hydrolase domain-containing protein n=1 Tax=Kangiella sp. HZ709 TaxID=2666328 RepID=UPI0012AFE04C|nr:serine hydrolase [Kangiella sp. HZ709]MRX28624.1 serine hydrolase [Kangiella sp. HZ709]